MLRFLGRGFCLSWVAVFVGMAPCLIFEGTAFAQSTQSKPVVKPKKKTPSNDPSTVVIEAYEPRQKEKSKHIRKKLKVGTEALVTPFSTWALIFGGRLSYALDAENHLMFRYLMGTLDLERFLPKPEGVSRSGTFSGRLGIAETRYFMTDTFAVTGGIGYRTGVLKINAIDEQQNVLNIAQTVTTIDAGIALGNYWIWPNGFTIGCDWLGVLFPVSSTFSSAFSSNFDDPDAEEDLVKKLNDNLSKVSRRPIATLGLFTIGYNF